MRLNHLACYLLLSVISCTGGTEQNETSSQHGFLIVSLDGATVNQFKTIQPGFQDLIAKLAEDYCSTNGFENYGTINSSTVEINSVKRCPVEWPESELCITVNVSVPVNSSNKYELSGKNLYSLWKTHSYAQLRDIGLKDYDVPSNSTILILWLCVTGLLFILFLIILILAIKTKFIENYIRRRRDVLGSANRTWLVQHGEKQLVPPFFYPEPPIVKLKEPQLHHAPEGNLRQRGMGIENPAYDPDKRTHRMDKQLSQGTTIVDDFDSDDETIYPPSPLPRLASNRKKRENGADSADELETAL